MNLLPILLIALLMGGEKLSTLKEFLSKIDFSSFTPIFKALGIQSNVIDFLSSETFSSLLSGQGDLKSILPLLSSFFKTPEKEEVKTTNSEEVQEEEVSVPEDFISPIKSVAPTDVEETLNNFFS